MNWEWSVDKRMGYIKSWKVTLSLTVSSRNWPIKEIPVCGNNLRHHHYERTTNKWLRAQQITPRHQVRMLSSPGASFVKERSPDFRERSSTKRFVPTRALSFFGIIKNFDPSSFSHVTRVFVSKTNRDFVRCSVCFKVFFLSFFLICYNSCKVSHR